ncbi:hypothetical protein POL68_09840 [Stigmatella sp. ncwal1]|uniref:Uncharacterized protein n=1 Tax=Stigmatella ashevillensis TaxID=2995309 RepID=A0ABT5D7E4_9BACT|nr:hypothetical protein [Stigmatella ashevillena]MDC0708768.1 hypothetical protein [Stigmatella ashevillena]
MSKSKKGSLPGASKGGKKGKFTGEMNPELQDALKELSKLVAESDTADAEAQYRIGCVVRDVMDAPRKYGDGSIKRLAVELGWDERSLDHRATVARAWSPEQYKALLARTNPKGLPLRFYVLVAIASVEDPTAREQIIKEALEKSLTVKAVRSRVKKLLTPTAETPSEAREEEDQGGVSAAEDPVAQKLAELLAQAKRMRGEWTEAEKALAGLEDEVATPEAAALLNKAAEELRALGQLLLADAGRLDAASGRVPSSLQQPRGEASGDGADAAGGEANSGNVSGISPASSSPQPQAMQEG